MTTIYKDNTNPLTVGETKRLIIGAMPTEMAASIFASFNENGELEVGSLTVGEPRDTCIHADFIDVDFPALCQQQGISPRNKYRPLFTDYSGAAEQDAYYTITHDEFVKLVKLFGAAVAIGTAPAQEALTPKPVVTVGVLDDEAWKSKARERAAEIIKRQREKDLYPSQEDIADEIAREFRVAGIVGTDGKPISGAYIKRHALNGISSAQGKQLSTRTGRGK